ncbi:MAG: long-chain fatty acid--CoA ligase, partial [bacterium]|nr:long-chain fatty acid--CoA ligase [bacterium]
MISVKETAFWKKSYDEGVDDVDPALWETTLVEVYKESFEEFSERTALAFMGVEITFAELHSYSNQFANMLKENGFQKGDVVGINMANIPEYVISYVGILKAGCVVSGVSPLLSAEEIEFQLKNSDAKGFVTLDAIFEKHVTAIHSRLPELKVVVAASIGGFLPGIKSFLGKLLGKIPKGKVTPLEGKKVYLFDDIIKTTTFSTEHSGVALTPDDL